MKRPVWMSALTAALVLGVAAPAGAHVTVNPREANKGSYAKLAFRVPNERPDHGTKMLEVAFPEDEPFRSVSVRPVPGWKITIEKRDLEKPLVNDQGEETTEVVRMIKWEAEGPEFFVDPGEFQEFEVSAGPTPEDADSLVFKAIQTYDGGEIVRWIEEAEEGSEEEPEHPAPVLKLIDPPDAEADTVSGKDEEADSDALEEMTVALAESQAALKKVSSDVDGAHAIAVVSIVVGGVALLLALRPRRPKAPKPVPPVQP